MTIKVLILEDDYEYRELFEDILARSDIQIFEAARIAEAEKIIVEHPDISAITVDSQLWDTESILDTCDFVRRVRASGFSGHMIASSSYDFCREMLIAAGCSHEIEDRKDSTAKKLLQVLGLWDALPAPA